MSAAAERTPEASVTLDSVRAAWDTVEAAISPVMADLERTRPGSVRLERDDSNDGLVGWLRDAETVSGTGLWLAGDLEEPVDAVLEMAAQVQEFAIEVVLWRAWPRCPTHPTGHPLELAEANGSALWACPESGHVVAEVGELIEVGDDEG